MSLYPLKTIKWNNKDGTLWQLRKTQSVFVDIGSTHSSIYSQQPSEAKITTILVDLQHVAKSLELRFINCKVGIQTPNIWGYCGDSIKKFICEIHST